MANLCSIRVIGEVEQSGFEKVVVKQLFFDGSDWLMRTSHVSLRMADYEPLEVVGPVVAIVYGLGQPRTAATSHAREVAEYRSLLLQMAVQGQPVAAGGLIRSLVGNGPVYRSPETGDRHRPAALPLPA